MTTETSPSRILDLSGLSDEAEEVLLLVLLERWVKALTQPPLPRTYAEPWREWFEFCAQFRPSTPPRPYRDILDESYTPRT